MAGREDGGVVALEQRRGFTDGGCYGVVVVLMLMLMLMLRFG